MPRPKFFGKSSPFASVFADVKNRVQEDEVFNFDIASLNGKHTLDLVVLFFAESFHSRIIRMFTNSVKTNSVNTPGRFTFTFTFSLSHCTVTTVAL